MRVNLKILIAALVSVPLLAIPFAASSTTVRIGVVEQAKRVNLQSGGGGGAVVGGAIGYNLGSGNSDSKKRRRAIIGSALGSAAATKTEPGMEYTVKFGDGSTMAIISNQLGLAVGDCVSVEDAGKSVNIRQQDAVACDPTAAEVVEGLQQELVEDADECSAAKQELLAAETIEAVEIATAKAKILCN